VLRGKTDDPHVATGLLKLFLRELPQPLLTEQLADRFIAVMGSVTTPSLLLTFEPHFSASLTHNPRSLKGGATFEEKVKGLRECIYCLPEVNRDTLYAILALLHIIQVNRTINMMTSENLARYSFFLAARNTRRGTTHAHAPPHTHRIANTRISLYNPTESWVPISCGNRPTRRPTAWSRSTSWPASTPWPSS
jgi:hypothetical protein